MSTASEAADAYRLGLMGPQSRAEYEDAIKAGVVNPSDDSTLGPHPEAAGAHPAVKPDITAELVDHPNIQGASYKHPPADPQLAATLEGQTSAANQSDASRTILGALGTLNRAIPFASDLADGVGALSDYATGKSPSLSAAWTANRAGDQANVQRLAQQHPIISPAISGIGAAIPAAAAFLSGGASAAAPALAEAAPGALNAISRGVGGVARSATVGGAFGALGGLGSPGDLSQRLGAADMGAGAGAAMGAAIPVAVGAARGVGALGSYGAKTAGDLAAGIKNALSKVDPEAAATPADTATALTQLRSIMGAQGMTPEQLVDSFNNKGATVAEQIGRPGVQTLGALARQPGTTPDALESLLRDRNSGTQQRILDDFSTSAGIHPQDAAGDMEAMTARGRAAAKPLFDAALSSPAPVWNADLAKLTQRPVIKQAIHEAAQDMLNGDKSPTAMGLTLDPDTGWTVNAGGLGEHGGLLPSDLSSATEPQPTAETWDLIRKNVNNNVERDANTNRPLPDSISPGNRRINQSARDLTTALAGDPASGVPGAIPGYREALDQSGDYLRNQNAFDRAGDMLFNSNVSVRDFGKVFASLSEPEQQAWRAGLANKLNAKFEGGRLTPGQLTVPGVQGKLTAVLGPDQAAGFAERLQNEARLSALGGRMNPGSGPSSMEYLKAAHEQGATPSAFGLGFRLLHNSRKMIPYLIDQGRAMGTAAPVRNELGRMLMSQSPEAVAGQLQDGPRPLPQLAKPPAQIAPMIAAGVSAALEKRRRR